MPVTREQFDKLIGEGLTVEEIAEFDKRSQQQPVQQQSQIPTQTSSQPQQQRPSILAQLARAFMRNAPIEQMKTTQFAQQNIPEPKPGQSLEQYVQSAQPVMQKREEDIAKKGTIAQFEAPVMASLAVAGGVNPVQTLKGLAKFGVLEGLAKISGLNQAIEKIPQPELKDMADIGKMGLEGYASSVPWKIPKPTTGLAGRVINSLIRPRHKEFTFGKNPGEAIAQEGIVAYNLNDLKSKVGLKKQQINNSISQVRASAENFDKKIDATATIQPLRETHANLKQLGEKTHAPEIQRLENAITDLTTNKNLAEMSVSDAYKLKEAVSSMQNWQSENAASHRVNVAIRKTYHLIDKAIDKQIPELEGLNSRLANLISAEQAINNRIEVLQRNEPMPTVLTLLNLPFAALKTTSAKTILGRLLATQLPQVKSTK